MIFLHTADWHLDASMEAGLSQAKASERRRELYLAFEKMAEDAEEMGAKAILIAGDLFDGANPSPSAVSRVSAVMEAHPNIDFILLCGNHDSTARVHLPTIKNLKTFEEKGVFRYENVAVYGAEDPSVSPAELGILAEDCNIVMLHGETRASGSEQIALTRWENRGVDYLALGHYHRYESHALDGRGKYVYAGCPAGRGFDECGEKGYVKLTVEDGKVREEFIPLAGRRYHTVALDISAMGSAYEIETATLDATRDIPKQDAVKVELTGECIPSLLPDTKMLSTRLSSRFWLGKVKDCTTLKADIRETDKSLFGVFARLVGEKIEDEAMRQRVLTCGLKALRGEETAE